MLLLFSVSGCATQLLMSSWPFTKSRTASSLRVKKGITASLICAHLAGPTNGKCACQYRRIRRVRAPMKNSRLSSIRVKAAFARGLFPRNKSRASLDLPGKAAMGGMISFAHSRLRPIKPRDRRSGAVEVLHHDVVVMSGHSEMPPVSSVCECSVQLSIKQPPVHPEPHAVIANGVKLVQPGASRLHLAGPAHGEIVCRHSAGGRGIAPNKIHIGVRSRDRERREIPIREIISRSVRCHVRLGSGAINGNVYRTARRRSVRCCPWRLR